MRQFCLSSGVGKSQLPKTASGSDTRMTRGREAEEWPIFTFCMDRRYDSLHKPEGNRAALPDLIHSEHTLSCSTGPGVNPLLQ